MSADRLELADVVVRFQDRFQDRYGARLSYEQLRTLRDIPACRTAALGGHVQQCTDCGHRQNAYNSCRNRHCPKCQAAARAEWLAARQQELLPVPYFHVVFTLPPEFSALALQNPRAVYGLLFRAASQTLLKVARNPRRLGAKIGFLSVLHTWGQNLMHHPHVHCVVPAGGMSLDGEQWVPCRRSRKGKEFFLPVRVLSRVFRGKFIAGLKRLFQAGKLKFFGDCKTLAQPAAFNQLLDQSVRQDWVVYAKRPFGGPEQVLKYLARYTHRVAISNQRLIAIDDHHVAFHYKDYADHSRTKVMQLDGSEFLRRFLMHVLPRGFVRIRHYGWLANRDRGKNLDLCLRLLRVSQSADDVSVTPVTDTNAPCEHSESAPICPACQKGKLLRIEEIPALRSLNPPSPHFRSACSRRAGLPGEAIATAAQCADTS
jgi:hypothetical protein